MPNEGAAANGLLNEAAAKETVESFGARLLKTYDEFVLAGLTHLYRTTSQISQKHTRFGEVGKGKFQTDGYVPEWYSILELKGRKGEGEGNTDEKMFYDLFKIEQGVYGDGSEFNFLYILQGAVRNSAVGLLFKQEFHIRKVNGSIPKNFYVLDIDKLDNEFVQYNLTQPANFDSIGTLF